MNRAKIVKRVAGEAQMTKDASETAVGAVFSSIGEALARRETVAITSFGRFARKHRPVHRGRRTRAPESAL